jgi:GNAT superfamily N-acetyltransferase
VVKLEKHDMHRIAPLFEGNNETLVWSCLQGCMGHAWTDNLEDPKCAKILTADFCFFAGNSRAPEARMLVRHIPDFFKKPCLFATADNEAWEALIEQEYENRYIKFQRYAFKKDRHTFDRDKLKAFVHYLPEGYELAPIDAKLYELSFAEAWSSDLCPNFLSWEDYQKRGLGFVVLHEGRIVCGASSYTVYNEGIEIEIDTHEDYRRKGLATACAARLILECLDRGLYPSWDAANTISVALAEKLGYHLDKPYFAYEIDLTK